MNDTHPCPMCKRGMRWSQQFNGFEHDLTDSASRQCPLGCLQARIETSEGFSKHLDRLEKMAQDLRMRDLHAFTYDVSKLPPMLRPC